MCTGVSMYTGKCAGMRNSVWVYDCTLGFVLVYIGVCGYARVCTCVWDEFSEFLPET